MAVPGNCGELQWLLALLAVALTTCAEAAQVEGTSPQSLPRYYWSTKGRSVRQDGFSPDIGPRNLSFTRSWSWRHIFHKHLGMPVGTPVIDDKMNLYFHDSDGWIVKFTHSGEELWKYDVGGASPCQHAIWNGTLVGCGSPGMMFALDMGTGEEVWKRQVADGFAGDGQSITIFEGVGLTVASPPGGGDNRQVLAISIWTGEVLWRFWGVQSPIYNAMITVLEEKRLVVFSDQWGCVFGVNFTDGQEVWRNCHFYRPHTFTTANGALGSNGIFYAVSHLVSGWDFTPALGCLHAVNATDGITVWHREFPTGLHASPAIGRLRAGGGLSVVLGLGDNTGMVPAMQLEQWMPGRIRYFLNWLSIRLGDWSRFLWMRRPLEGQSLAAVALDATTGADQWVFRTPTWWRPTCAGDEERFQSVMRGVLHRSRWICTCDSWSSATIDANGTVYVGNAYGVLYALKDENGDGLVTGDEEVSFEDLGDALLMPASIAPGMLAAVTCSEVIIYRTWD